ncbi:MAG: GNAT family N-acetyltransferase [Actinomycetota bacterium]|nr:GNAT family N-acetyltransferase [Actinomycetota bacterium]
MTIEVAAHSSLDAFDLPEWRALFERDPNSHIFATPEWNRLWWEEFGAGNELFVLDVRRGSDPLAIVPLYRTEQDGRRILRFVGGIDLTDYLGAICTAEDRGYAARALLDWLIREEIEWDEFDAHNMPVPFGFGEALVDWSDRLGFEFTLDQEETSAILVLAADWDAYLARLGSKNRHELRRKRRRLGRDYPDVRFRTTTSETLERDLELFVDMHRGAEGLKGHFMRPEIATFFERIARDFQPRGWLRLDFMEIDERAVASTFGFQLGHTFYLYNSAYLPEVARLSPGLVLVSELVKNAIADDHTRIFDFLRGPERYKYQLGSQAVPLNNVRVLNRGTDRVRAPSTMG